MDIKVSVVVPVYNVEKYLSQCLESLVGQTLQEIEILVINDGTPDNSQKIIDEFVERYPGRIKSFIKENGGLSDARNYGVACAQGEYIGFVDSDDYVRADMFELMYNRAREQSADMVVCAFSTVSQEGITRERHIITHEDYFNQSVESCPQILLESKSYACTKLYRRAWYTENQFSFPVGQWFEDSAVVYNMMYRANKVACVTDCLYVYRKDRPDSITNTNNNKKLFDIFRSCESIRKFFYDNSNNKEVLEVADRVCQVHLFARVRHIYSSSLKIKFLFYWKMLRFFAKYMPNWTENPYYKTAKKQDYLTFIEHPFMMSLSFVLPEETMAKLFPQMIEKKKEKTGYINNKRLRELQLTELGILKEIDRICNTQKLCYYLGGETLLGAVRHQGFVPWKDGISIVMRREDYDALLMCLPTMLSRDFVWLNGMKEPSTSLLSTRIIVADNHGFVNQRDHFGNSYSGPFIEILPLDYCTSNSKKSIEQKRKKISRLQKEIALINGQIKPKTLREKWHLYFAKQKTVANLYHSILQVMKSDGSNGRYLCCFVRSNSVYDEPAPVDDYGTARSAAFEDGTFPVPQNAGKILKSVFGMDYMKIPSVMNRKRESIFYDVISEETKKETKPLEKEQLKEAAMGEIRELQLYELDILKEVDRVCRENRITYYLGESTLLGAVRHQGFIPWDDELDIAMPREDLSRFMAICDEQLKPNYKFQFYHNIDNYWAQLPKVRLLDETPFAQSRLKRYTPDTGPYINIFPLDYAPASIEKLERQDRYIDRYRRMLLIKTGFSKPKNKKQKIYQAYTHFLTCRDIHTRMEKIAARDVKIPTEFICSFYSDHPIQQKIFPASYFGEPIYIPFEDASFPAPSKAQDVLTVVYGNYMELPLANKRNPHHNFD